MIDGWLHRSFRSIFSSGSPGFVVRAGSGLSQEPSPACHGTNLAVKTLIRLFDETSGVPFELLRRGLGLSDEPAEGLQLPNHNTSLTDDGDRAGENVHAGTIARARMWGQLLCPRRA